MNPYPTISYICQVIVVQGVEACAYMSINSVGCPLFLSLLSEIFGTDAHDISYVLWRVFFFSGTCLWPWKEAASVRRYRLSSERDATFLYKNTSQPIWRANFSFLHALFHHTHQTAVSLFMLRHFYFSRQRVFSSDSFSGIRKRFVGTLALVPGVR